MDVGIASPITETLTKREMQVLLLICDGRSTKRIAWDLGISFKTAACHRSRLMAKIGVHEVASLVCYAVRQGLLIG
jgi:DNA-binding NarL/FixJ family response regulator